MLVDRSARVWAMRRDDAVAAQALELRTVRDKSGQPMAIMAGERLEGSDFARVIDGVAVIPVKGPLMRSFSFWAWSYEEILRDVRLAQDDPGVTAIVLDIDSPGGIAAGCEDAVSAIRESGAKPITAFVGGMAASAAYWIATSAEKIVAGSGAIVGSVGAVIEYVDMEPYFEKIGARIVRVVSEQSPNKRLDPDSDAGKAELQALVDATCAGFVATVAKNRNVSVETVIAEFGQGLVFDGAEAIRRGMADGRSTLEDLIAGLARVSGMSRSEAARILADDTGEPLAVTLAALQFDGKAARNLIGATVPKAQRVATRLFEDMEALGSGSAGRLFQALCGRPADETARRAPLASQVTHGNRPGQQASRRAGATPMRRHSDLAASPRAS